jgi:hypothetical protein
MKRHVIISFALAAALVIAKAEDAPSQSPSPGPSTGEIEEPALPAPEAAPSDTETGLLPESGELPDRPSAQPPGNSTPSHTSQRHAFEKDGRFDKIRSLAVSNPRAASLLRRARHSSNSASRRSYLRAYYVTVASRMRKLDPKLKSSIDAYEEAKINEIPEARSSTARASSHHLRRHRTASQEAHHKRHRVSSERHYRRMIIIDERNGPWFPPYGPPVVFAPW